mmetsp:Transcript_123640/g.357652  ORF Transcript_123640/g.357652 Transcript_123640/m.357652 type:complete len:333 (+) Transcript_123640:52-1050(+)
MRSRRGSHAAAPSSSAFLGSSAFSSAASCASAASSGWFSASGSASASPSPSPPGGLTGDSSPSSSAAATSPAANADPDAPSMPIFSCSPSSDTDAAAAASPVAPSAADGAPRGINTGASALNPLELSFAAPAARDACKKRARTSSSVGGSLSLPVLFFVVAACSRAWFRKPAFPVMPGAPGIIGNPVGIPSPGSKAFTCASRRVKRSASASSAFCLACPWRTIFSTFSSCESTSCAFGCSCWSNFRRASSKASRWWRIRSELWLCAKIVRCKSCFKAFTSEPHFDSSCSIFDVRNSRSTVCVGSAPPGPPLFRMQRATRSLRSEITPSIRDN